MTVLTLLRTSIVYISMFFFKICVQCCIDVVVVVVQINSIQFISKMKKNEAKKGQAT